MDQPFREDESNRALTRTRGRIRHDLLPRLATEYNPAVREALFRLGALSAGVRRVIDRDARAAARHAMVTTAENEVVLDHGLLRSTPRMMLTEILREVWRRAGWPEVSMSARRWHRLAGWIRRREIRPRTIGARVEVSSDGSVVVLRRLPTTVPSAGSSPPRAEITLALPGTTDIPWAECRIDAATDEFGHGSRAEVVDYDRLAGTGLVVRAPEPGDRFGPLGMGGKTMSLADFFRGRRVPRAERNQTPLVCDRLGIVWVAGHRIADRVKTTEVTERMLCLRLRRGIGIPRR